MYAQVSYGPGHRFDSRHLQLGRRWLWECRYSRRKTSLRSTQALHANWNTRNILTWKACFTPWFYFKWQMGFSSSFSRNHDIHLVHQQLWLPVWCCFGKPCPYPFWPSRLSIYPSSPKVCSTWSGIIDRSTWITSSSPLPSPGMSGMSTPTKTSRQPIYAGYEN